MTLPSYAGWYAKLIDVTDAARAPANSSPFSTTHRVHHESVPAGTGYCEKLISRWGLVYFTVCAKQQCEFWAETCASFTRHPALLMLRGVCLEITGQGNVDPNGGLPWARRRLHGFNQWARWRSNGATHSKHMDPRKHSCSHRDLSQAEDNRFVFYELLCSY